MLVRHARAADAPVDADRPLTPLGARRAAAIGAWLADHGLSADLAVVSPARRTLQTWQHAGGSGPLAVDPRLYDNTVEALLTAIAEVPDDVAQLVVVGHNPSVSELAALLDDGDGPAAARRQVADGFPPGGVALFTLEAPFAAIGPGTARLVAAEVPGAEVPGAG